VIGLSGIGGVDTVRPNGHGGLVGGVDREADDPASAESPFRLAKSNALTCRIGWAFLAREGSKYEHRCLAPMRPVTVPLSDAETSGHAAMGEFRTFPPSQQRWTRSRRRSSGWRPGK
jgi:hypothetical protein